MLTIRLARVGKKSKPLYRVVISEKAKDLYGNALEILGSYNPYTKELKINSEKTKYWLSKGVGMSATVNNLLIEKKIIEGKKVKASKGRKDKKTPADKPAEAKLAQIKTAEAKPTKAEATPKLSEAIPTPAKTAEAPVQEKTPKTQTPAV